MIRTGSLGFMVMAALAEGGLFGWGRMLPATSRSEHEITFSVPPVELLDVDCMFGSVSCTVALVALS
jgi:hypothetical protein